MSHGINEYKNDASTASHLRALEVQKYIEKLNFGARSALGTIQCVECRLDCPLRDRDLHPASVEMRVGPNILNLEWEWTMFVTIGTAKRATLKEVFLQNLQDIFEICAHVCSVVGGFVDPRPLTHDLEVPLMHPWGFSECLCTSSCRMARCSILGHWRREQRGCGLYMNYKPLPRPTNKQQKKSLVFRISA